MLGDGFQAEHDGMAAGTPHEAEKFRIDVFVEAQHADPVRIQAGLDDLPRQAPDGGRMDGLVREIDAVHAVPLPEVPYILKKAVGRSAEAREIITDLMDYELYSETGGTVSEEVDLSRLCKALGSRYLTTASDSGIAFHSIVPDDVSISRTFWMLMHADSKDLARIRAVADYIHETVERERALFKRT